MAYRKQIFAVLWCLTLAHRALAQVATTPFSDQIPKISTQMAAGEQSTPSAKAVSLTAAQATTDDFTKQDLEAQQSMARAAWCMLAATVLQSVLSAVGIWFIWATLKATRQSVEAGDRSAKAAQEAAEATFAGVQATRSVSDAQTRPWVSLTCFLEGGFRREKTHAGMDGYYLSFRAKAKNHGLAPATNIHFHAEIGLEGPSKESMRAYCNKVSTYSIETGNVLFPGTEELEWHEVFLPLEDIEKQLSKTSSNILSPVVYGCINYQSLQTQGVRQTRFAYLITRNERKGALVSCIVKDGPNWMERPVALCDTGIMEAD